MSVKRKPTISDVASQAGVSIATVSNVINGTKFVGDDVTRKINEAIERLNYIPNSVAKSLRVKKSKLIGLMISDISNPFFPPVVRGIEDTLAKNGFNVLLCDTDTDTAKEQEYLRLLLGRRIDGLLVSLAGAEHSYFRNLDIPVVFFNRVPESEPCNIVETENAQGGFIATDHLIKHGYGRIAVIAGPQHLSVGHDRLRGYRAAIDKSGCVYDPDLVKISPFEVDAGYRAMKELMEQEKRPDAVFTCNNFLTLGAFRFLHEAEYKIPEDIAIVGYDDTDWTNIVDPPMTVVRHEGFEMGTATGNLLLDCLRKKDSVAPRRIVLKLELAVRKSCGCNKT